MISIQPTVILVHDVAALGCVNTYDRFYRIPWAALYIVASKGQMHHLINI